MLERSQIRLTATATATGWQTIAKAIEREVNSIPLGYLHHQGSLNPLLRVLCPSLLKNGTYSDRAPKGIFSIPDSALEMTTNIVKIYNMWFQLWNTTYLPLVMDRPKWQMEEDNLKTDDLVYFNLTDSKLSADWRVGKVEYANIGRDGKVREVGIAFKNMDEEEDWKHSLVERPVRSVVKLMNIEDTSIIEDMKKIEEEVKVILRKQTPVLSEENVQEVNSDSEPLDNKKIQIEVEKPKRVRRKRRTELERLLDDNLNISPDVRRNAANNEEFYATTESEAMETLFYTNTVLAFDESKSEHASHSNLKVGVTTAAIFSGVRSLGDAEGLQGDSEGDADGVGGVEDVSCNEKFYDCNNSIYLL